MSENTNLIIQNLTKVYPNHRRALDRIELEIGEGVFGLLGPNGAGKSTLMQILSGSLDCEQGDVFLDGKWSPRLHPIEWRRRLSTVPQSFDFVPHLTGEEYLQQYALMAGYSPRRLIGRIHDLLRRVHLYDARKRSAVHYSRGMKQRLAIAASFLCESRLVLLDEPTSGLDPKERVFFRDLLAELGEGRIVVLSTHIVGDVERCSDRMAVLSGGRIVFHGKPEEVSGRARGQVWDCPVSTEELADWQSRRRLVRLWEENGLPVARLVSPSLPSAGARQAEAGLEDGYFVLLNEIECPAGQ